MCFMFPLCADTGITFSNSCYLFKILSAYNDYIAVLHTLPFFLRKSLGVLITYIYALETVINHCPDVLFITEDSTHRNITPKRLFLSVFCQLVFIFFLHGNVHSRRHNSFFIQRLSNFIHELFG